ncbi:MAG: nicotinate (nicotinamide) nucleotide adenylyltransferase [Luteolibacter sp.]
MKVGIFGGSFDPVHEGHLYVAEICREAAGLDEVWFLPCHISPHKTDRPPSPGERRIRWLEMATAGLDWARIEDCEVKSREVSYSYETLRGLSERFPENEWFWIMGGDQWEALETWAHPEVMAGIATFVVVTRGGAELVGREGYRLVKVNGDHAASSTEIRSAVRSGREGIPFLHPEVEADLLRDR